MRPEHLSGWDEEEYVLGERSPEVVQHLEGCAACRLRVAQLEHGTALFRRAAVDWSTASLKGRLERAPVLPQKRLEVPALGWALAAVLLILALVPIYDWNGRDRQITPAAINDDALLQRVDEQVSAAVPSPMESLTYLVSAEASSGDEGSSLQRGSNQYAEKQ